MTQDTGKTFIRDQLRKKRLRDLFGYNTEPPFEHPSSSDEDGDGRKFMQEMIAGAKWIANGPMDNGQIE